MKKTHPLLFPLFVELLNEASQLQLCVLKDILDSLHFKINYFLRCEYIGIICLESMSFTLLTHYSVTNPHTACGEICGTQESLSQDYTLETTGDFIFSEQQQ